MAYFSFFSWPTTPLLSSPSSPANCRPTALQSPNVAITLSNEVPWYLSSVPPQAHHYVCSLRSISAYFQQHSQGLRSSLCDEIIRGTVTFPRESAAYKNTLFFSGEPLCQGARNAAEGRSPEPVKGSIKGMI